MCLFPHNLTFFYRKKKQTIVGFFSLSGVTNGVAGVATCYTGPLKTGRGAKKWERKRKERKERERGKKKREREGKRKRKGRERKEKERKRKEEEKEIYG